MLQQIQSSQGISDFKIWQPNNMYMHMHMHIYKRKLYDDVLEQWYLHNERDKTLEA